MPFWLKSKALTWANPERAPSRYSSKPQVYARRRPGRRTTTIVLPGSLTEAPFVEPLVAYHIKGTVDCISEEVLALTGNYLKQVVGVVDPHLALVRLSWGRGRGRLLRQLMRDYAPK